MARKKANGRKGTKLGKKKSKAKGKPGSKRPKRSSKPPLNFLQMQALSSELRVKIIAILCERVASPKEIAEELGEGLSQVSYHVLVLRKCGLILLDHKTPRRGAVEHFYRAATATLIPPGAWDRLPPAMRKGISADILQCFFDDARTSMEAEVFDEPPGELNWTPLVLDTEGVEEFGQLARDFLESVLELQANVTERQGEAGKATDTRSATIFLASFLSARGPAENMKASATRRR